MIKVFEEILRLRWPAGELEELKGQGVYAVFLREGGDLPGIEPGAHRALYVGMSGKGLNGRDHVGYQHSGSSTLRRSLGALLRERLGLQPVARDSKIENATKFRFTDEGEASLTAWMTEHLLASQVEIDPADVSMTEKALISELRPPLNLTNLGRWINQQKAFVSAARERCAEAVRAGFSGKEPPRLTFTMLLEAAGIPIEATQLIRHSAKKARGKLSPYELWAGDPEGFAVYQSSQSRNYDTQLQGARYWASFVALPESKTLFVGLYEARRIGLRAIDYEDRVTGVITPPGNVTDYGLTLSPLLSDYAGRLWIDWGPGTRAIFQKAVSGPKTIVELKRTIREEPFPGFLKLIRNLSQIETMPATWQAALAGTRGIYLLTCPEKKEQYVGKASGAGGFLQRWMEYAATGHGGNVGLKGRPPSDFRVSILETVGSAASEEEILQLEEIWKLKLQSSLNRN